MGYEGGFGTDLTAEKWMKGWERAGMNLLRVREVVFDSFRRFSRFGLMKPIAKRYRFKDREQDHHDVRFLAGVEPSGRAHYSSNIAG